MSAFKELEIHDAIMPGKKAIFVRHNETSDLITIAIGAEKITFAAPALQVAAAVLATTAAAGNPKNN